MNREHDAETSDQKHARQIEPKLPLESALMFQVPSDIRIQPSTGIRACGSSAWMNRAACRPAFSWSLTI